MRHRKAGHKFSRPADQRLALTRAQVTALLKNGRIVTTEAKAKELRRWVERVITTAKGEDQVHAHRMARRWVLEREAHARLFDTYLQRYRDRPGGYTRVLHLGQRHGDGAQMAIIELVEAHERPAAAEQPRRRRGRTQAAS